MARRRLWVHINHQCCMASILSRSSQMQGQSGFSSPTLLADNRYCWHANVLT
ncbi:hypothetical protein SXCC_00300 [Gluconacetobacter sp. SXCC-1]|nr:hypothetical protein SXCC_00300 [Gluconacetobacter sp. SXCC-1]